MTARVMALSILAAITAGCGDDASPTEPSETAASAVTYTGTLEAGGSRFYSFSNAAAGSVTAFLASVASPDTQLPVAVPLEIGIGVPAGTGCATTTTQILAPSLISQMTVPLEAGIFCLRVADAGEITSPVMFAVRFLHP